MNNLEEDQNLLEKGVKQLLGKEEYDPPEPIIECSHVSDGYIYEDTPVFTTLRCRLCGLHFDKMKV